LSEFLLRSDVVKMAGQLYPLPLEDPATQRAIWRCKCASPLPRYLKQQDHCADIASSVLRHGRCGFMILGFGGWMAKVNDEACEPHWHLLQGLAGLLSGVNPNTRAQNTNTRNGTKSLRNPSG
jgi:hypothetical protein